jgi:hypothetical protein
MADVDINKFRASVVRDGSKPASPGFVVSEGQDPVNPPGTNNYVPYSGATANVELGEFGVEAGFITLDTTPTNTPTDQGTIFWDADDETVDIVLNGYTMKIGEDLFYPVKNQTGSTIAKGVAVRFNGTLGASGRLLIAPFIADGSVPSSRFMGVTAEEILNGEDGKVLYFGRVRGINTNAFNEGDILYASTTVAGGYQTAIPVAPNNIVQVAAVVTKHVNNGTIFVRPTLGSNLNTDEAVKLTSVADKNLLQYQSGTALWENKSLAQVLGGTSSQFVKGDGSLDSTSYGTGTVTSVGLSSATSGVTIGSSPVTTSGTITLAIATASGSQNGLLSSTDWTTFNSKQNALTNPVTGTGTTNYLPKFTGSTTIGNSQVFDNGTNVGIGTASPVAKLTINQLPIAEVGSTSYGTAVIHGINYNLSNTQRGIVDINNIDVAAQNNGSTLTFTNNAGMFGQGYSFVGVGLKAGKENASNQNQSTYFAISTNSNGSLTERMRLYSDGNLFIGSSPSNNGARLQVSGTATISSALTSSDLTIKNSANAETLDLFLSPSTLNGFIDYPSGRSLTIRNKGSLGGLTIASTGAATFDTTSAISAIFNSTNASGGYLAFRRSGTNIGYLGNSAQLGIGVNNALELRADNNLYLTTTSGTLAITSGGNVLIGTTTDNGARLQVSGFSGAVNQNNGIKLTNNAGTIVALEIGASNDSYIGTISGSNFSIRCNNNPVITVDIALNVGIGTTSPSANYGLTVCNPTLFSSNALRLERNGVPDQGLNISAGGEQVTFNGFNTDSGGLNSAFVWTSTAFNTTTERMRITSDTAAFLRMASGTGGIQFNGDTAAANALDDYEEGTWTPTITGGYTGITYSFQNGWYRKIGSAVIVSGRVSFTGTANGAGISMACPFTQGPTGYASGGIPYSDIAVITNTHPYLTGGSSSVLFYTTGTGAQIGSGATNVVDKWLSFVITMSV